MRVMAKQVRQRSVYKWDRHGDAIVEKVKARLRKRTAKVIKDKMEGITKGKTDLSREWEHKVKFAVQVREERGEIRLYAYPTTNQDVWHWVSKGTKPHVIEAKNAEALVFQWGFAKYSPPPKSYPKGAVLPPGGGAETVAFKRVHHPGTEPRNFEERAMKDFRIPRQFREDVRDGVEDWKRDWSVFK